MPKYYPPVAFNFHVSFAGGQTADNDTRFSEVAGLSVELETEEVAEGGQNRFLQKFPGRAKYPDLVLKRGLLVESEMASWVQQCIEDYDIEPRNLDIILRNEEQQPLMTWHVVNAYPTKWEISDFSSTANKLVVESITLFYQYFTVDRG